MTTRRSFSAGGNGPGSAGALDASLRWLFGILWPGAQVAIDRGRIPRRVARSGPCAFGVFRGPWQPLLLIPLSDRRATAAAVRHNSRGSSVVERLLRSAAWLALRVGALQPFLGTRVVITGAGGGPPGDGFIRFLEQELGTGPLVMSVAVRVPLQPNHNPVVHLLTPSGRTVGFAKIGWNAVTRRHVGNEMSFLEHVDPARLHRIVVPEPLYGGAWRGNAVSVVSPLDLRRRLPRGTVPDVDLLRELAALSEVTTVPLATSEFWQQLQTGADKDPEWGDDLRAITEAIEARDGATPLVFGLGHGDFRQKNMAIVDGGYALWDWEQWRQSVPIGLDLLHFHFQTCYWSRRSDVGESASTTLARSGPLLEALGVSRDVHDLLLQLYLLDRVVLYGQEYDEAEMGSAVRELCRDSVAWLAARVGAGETRRSALRRGDTGAPP